MVVKSLMDLASAACIKHIRHLDSVGDYLPYENVRHILLRVENAHQLRRIELNSPQLQGRTGEIWLKLIEREFPIEYRSKGYKPQDPSKWYKVWERYKKDHDASVEESASKLKNAFMGLKQDKEQNTSRIVEKKLLPRSAAGPKRGGPRDHTRTNLAFASGSRTKTMSGAGVMRKVRREVKEMATIHGSLSTGIRGPLRHAEVKKAPPGLVGAYKRAAKPSHEPPRRAPVPQVSSVVKDHEARATFISDSEGDDDDGDLFDEPDSPHRPAAKPTKLVRLVSKPAPVPSALGKGLAGRMAQKFGNPARIKSSAPTPKPQAASPQKPSPQKSPPKLSGRPSKREASPPPNPTADSSGVPPIFPRKRKAASLFHKPNKRVH